MVSKKVVAKQWLEPGLYASHFICSCTAILWTSRDPLVILETAECDRAVRIWGWPKEAGAAFAFYSIENRFP